MKNFVMKMFENAASNVSADCIVLLLVEVSLMEAAWLDTDCWMSR